MSRESKDDITEQNYQADMLRAHDDKLQAAAVMFAGKEGLSQAIKSQVSPAIFPIRTQQRVGVGFFPVPNWMVSNQHILRYSCELPFVSMKKKDGSWDQVDHQRSFHYEQSDFAAIKTIRSRACLSMMASLNECHNESYYFCVDYDEFGVQQIKFLNRISAQADGHVYESAEGDPPQPGCSGSPVVKARVILAGGEPRWEFSVVGVLYARSRKNNRMIYVTPIGDQFAAMLKVLLLEDSAQRCGELYDAACVMGDTAIAASCKTEAGVLANKAKKLLDEQQNAPNALLPDQEPLWYNRIVKLWESLLFPKMLLLALKSDASNYSSQMPKGVTLPTLQGEFKMLLSTLSAMTMLQFKVMNMSLLQTKNLRVDMEGGGASQDSWFLSVEDNIMHRGKRVLYRGKKSLSSVFAKVKIPAKQVALVASGNKVSGRLIAKLLDASQEWGKVAFLVFAVAAKKKRKKKGRHKSVTYRSHVKSSKKSKTKPSSQAGAGDYYIASSERRVDVVSPSSTEYVPR